MQERTSAWESSIVHTPSRHRMLAKLSPLVVEEDKEPDAIERVYRVYISAPAEQKAHFHNSRCLFLVSVGQPYHEGAKLEVALKAMNKNFKEVVVMVGDTIQRYTHAAHLDKDPETLFELANTEGDKWLDRHANILKNAPTKPHQVFRWDHYKSRQSFNQHYAKIQRDVWHDPKYRAVFELDAQKFLKRAGRSEKQMSARAADLCFQYLIEECACMCVWAEEGFEFVAYPYGIYGSFWATYQRYIEPNFGSIMQKISYGIKGRDRVVPPHSSPTEYTEMYDPHNQSPYFYGKNDSYI